MFESEHTSDVVTIMRHESTQKLFCNISWPLNLLIYTQFCSLGTYSDHFLARIPSTRTIPCTSSIHTQIYSKEIIGPVFQVL